MFRLLFSVVFLLLNTVAFAAFDKCHFNYGRQWQNSFNENTDFSGKGLSHLAIWIGDNDNYNQYWEGSMVRAAKKNNLTPVFYAYVIAEYDKDQGNQDCDVGSPNHCTNGAETIRNKWSSIISRYRSYAQGVAQDFGTSGTTIWLIEPDFFQYSVSGDNHDTRFNQVGGGIPDADLCGKYFNDIVSTIKSALPNAKIAVDISPWLNDGLVTWYANFDKSKVDYLFSSGGRTQGNQERIRSDNNNLVTWAFASSAMGGKKIIADDGYGVGGASNNDYGDWLNVSNLNNRISDGVIGLTIQEPNDSYYTFAASNPLNMCSGGVSSSSISVTPSSSSQAVAIATKKTLVVDDLEDGDTVSLWGGDWAIYNDNANGGASSVERSFVTGNSSSKAIQVSYSLNAGSLTYDPFIGLVVATNADGESTENLSTCTSIQYDYKGAAHSFRVESPNITDAAYFETSVTSTNSWTTKTVSWNSLAQPTWGISKSLSSTRESVRAFSWQIQAASGSGTLQIDNVKCLGLAEGSSSSSTVSSSSSVPSSSSITSSSSIQSSSSVVSSSSAASSSSSIVSSSSALSSSSVAVSSEWQSNTKLTVNENTVVIGQSNNYSDERHVTKNLGNLVTGETYKLSFDATESAGGQEFEITTTLNEYCNEKTTLTGGNTATVTCTFTAKSNDEAILTLDMPASRWEEITISNFSFGVVSALQTFTITFVNGTEVLQQETLEEGSLPNYNGEKPVKESTEKYIYNFKGWSPEIAVVAGNATYKAVFDSVLVRYYVQFLNGENVLQADSLGYGILPTYNATTPTKEATQAYTYTFKGWSPEISVVASNATYKAVFDSILNKFTVTFVDEDGAILKAATAYDYGTSAENIVLPADPTKPSTDSQTFSFAGWTPALSAVTENVVYKATYSSTTNAYTITFVNGSETLQSSAVAFGETPAYSGQVPTKAATQAYTYSFKGWSPEISVVAGNATYKAVFDSALVRYYVQFLNGDNVLQADSLGYGILPTYNAATPTKAATQAYTYTFKGWSPEIAVVAGNATYKAVFDSTLIPESSSSIESSSSSEAVVPAIVTECSIKENQLNVSITPASDGSSWNLQFNVFDALGNVIRSSEKISGTASSYTFLVPSIAPTATTQTYYAYIYLNDKAKQACPSTLSWNVASVVVPSSSSEAPVVSSSSLVDEPVSSSSVEESSSSEISSSSMDSSSSEAEIQSSSSETPVVSSSSLVEELVSSSSVEESSSSVISSSSMDSSSSEAEIQSSSSEITDGLENALIPSLALSLDGRKLQIHGAKDVQVRLFDLQGVPRYTVNNVNGFVDLNNLPAGSYIVYVKTKYFSLSRRLILR